MGTLLNIENVYMLALKPGQGIKYNYLQKEEDLRVNREISGNIEDLVNSTRAELGIAEIPPIALDKVKAEELRQAIKSQKNWKEHFHYLMNLAGIPPESQSEDAVYLPWWNDLLLHVSDERYKKDELSLDASIAHSYATQLLRRGKIKAPSMKAISISNVLITSDGFIVLGWRGGHNFADTIMSVPAGSIEYHTGKDPIFESLATELDEEVGLSQADVVSAELIGKLNGGMIEGNPHYVTRVKTAKSLAQTLKHWDAAKDYKEHKHMFGYPDDCQFVSNRIKTNLFNIAKANQDNMSMTTQDNIGAILHQCAGALIVHYMSTGEIYEFKPDFNSARWNEL
jgi:hypothetical protein